MFFGTRSIVSFSFFKNPSREINRRVFTVLQVALSCFSVPMNASTNAFARGDLGGIRITRVPWAFQKSLYASGNLRSPSRIRKRGSTPCSASHIEALRDCCMIHAESGDWVARLQ